MTDIQKAMLGDKQAQERVTERGEMLPCPICGGTDVKMCYVMGDLWFQCNKCGCGCGFRSSEKAARKDWNTRPAMLTPEQIKRLEELE